ncbi:hypothetical protein GSI_10283 [Ganoderma sinense ZZ0214-1]|uniref:Uncharacterized protein n=1 Tax=Ganoderma sinense ZZ0214-1 TaxID=1077348 RepID=A0A2G8S046_9APHY|nr:hypothetical protein GSI_10283 [Ganoderma sinense ZZ0214-1]
MDPRRWENGQRLDECREGMFTEAAQKAQDAKWKRLMANRPPRDALPRSLMPRPGRSQPPLYHYGFPFTNQYVFDYTRRHRLSLPVPKEDQEFFGGCTAWYFEDLADAWLKSGGGDEDDLEVFKISVSRMLMLEDLRKRCRFVLGIGHPFSDDWDGIVSLWSNYNFDDRFDRCIDPVHVIEVLKAAMNESGGRNSETPVKPQWWFDWDNDVGVFTSIA